MTIRKSLVLLSKIHDLIKLESEYLRLRFVTYDQANRYRLVFVHVLAHVP